MTDRRPHWDDDLIEAVRYAAHDWGPKSNLDTYAVIAAVEDWQAEKRRGEAAFSWLMARDARQQAAIQRVQEEVGGDNPIPKASDDMDNVVAYCAGYVDALRRVRRALDGVRCGAGESEVYDHRCTLIQGHAGWHQDWRDGRLWAEWRETWRETLDGTDG